MLVKVTNDILCALDKGRSTLLVALDVSAAFDTVEHNLLINRYREYFGLTSTALKWMESYLADRQQVVQVGSSFSDVKPVDSGFPQGSVLGGPKFTMYATPLHVVAQSHEVEDECYADDSNLFLSFDVTKLTEYDDAKLRMEACVADMKSLMIQSRLKLNSSKTEVILFQPPKNKQLFSIKVGGVEMSSQSKVESLGVVLDDSLKMVTHINTITSTAHFHLRRISKKRSVFNRKVTETLVNSLVLSRLDYCNSLLCQLPKKLMYKLQKVQNAAAKLIMLARKRDHATPLLKQLHWLPMAYRCKFKVLVLTFKVLNGEAPVYLRPLISEYLSTRLLRSSNELLLRRPPRSKSKYGDRAFSQLAPALWNCLPLGVRHAKTLSEFKGKLKAHFYLQHYGPE